MALVIPANDVEESWRQFKGHYRRIKRGAADAIAAPQITRLSVLQYADQLATDLAGADGYAQSPGIEARARAELNNGSLDFAAEWAAVRAQIVATQDWIVTRFPKAADNTLAVFQFDANKRTAPVFLTAGELSQFKNQLNALLATLN